MYKGTNPSALRSRNEITKALIRLMEDKPFDQLSIKEIMEASGYSRQTFYQIFDSKEEVLEYYLETIFKDFSSAAESWEIRNLCDAAKMFFTFFESYKKPLSRIVRGGQSCVLQRKCREFLQRNRYVHFALKGVRSEPEQEYSAIFVVSGMTAMLDRWLQEEEPSLDPKEMADLICRITKEN